MKRLAPLLLLAACAAPHTPVTRAAEEDARVMGSPTAPSSRVGVPRVTPSAASRSRRPFPRLTGHGTGSHTLASTAYCVTGLMANGHRTHQGAVAANRWPLGTRLHVSDSPYGPGVFTVEDRYGWGTSLDFAMPGDCQGAREWGRRDVQVEVLR